MLGRGYALGDVNVVIRAELPKEFIDRVREQAEAKREGLTSKRRAAIEVHGEDQADEVLEEIAEDEAAAAKAAQASIFGSLPPAFGAPDEAAAQTNVDDVSSGPISEGDSDAAIA